MTPPVRSPRERTGLLRGLVVAAGVVLVSTLLMLLAGVQGVPRFGAVPPPQVTRSAEPLPEPSATGEPLPEPPGDADPAAAGQLIVILLWLVAAALLALLVVAVVRALRRAWQSRALREREGAAVTSTTATATAEAEPDAAVIQRGIAAALQRIHEPAAPGDAIVAAWWGVEEAAADSGVVRGVSETPGEFAVRIIARRSAIGEDARRLLVLYERVRFGGYGATEADRAEARRLLERIEREWR
ncbi:hypothetical protein GCM10025760_31980 [Microbacterium yannicii]|uniref:Protein-glutamine gamma-glutamyltransferase-like C-terminal domain-containing protein n=1 Tax=Microbacterium yannicii TaxID=671622 RepID=A0ABP9MMP3_9MICO|nr:DUF4129 domain-containing protein [Microbacterium yannicii]MCO5951675.1 DUF4129 domain-containing protein [Microbacterium yannicii]